MNNNLQLNPMTGKIAVFIAASLLLIYITMLS